MICFDDPVSTSERRNPTRLWEIWPADGSRVLCRGICITGRQPILLIIALACAVVPFASFMRNRNPEATEGPSVALIFLVVWFSITVILILKIALSDPGIIPRRWVAEHMYPEHMDMAHRQELIDPFRSIPGGTYCHSCEITRPPNASHCSECNNCVLGFDHHCAVLNTCIGHRNYPFFMMLLPCIFLLAISFLFQIEFPSMREGQSDPTDHGAVYKLVSASSLTIAISALLLVVALLGYHLWLLVRGTTTKQHLKGLTGDLTIFDRLRGSDALFDLRQPVMIPQSLSKHIV